MLEHVGANLAGYKVPRDFVYVAELPRNATGKILKREVATYDREVMTLEIGKPAPDSPSRTSTARTCPRPTSVAGRTW